MDNGFLDKLRLANIFGNGMAPGVGAQSLFGGLIPPRYIDEERRRPLPEVQMQQPGINQVASNMVNAPVKKPLEPRKPPLQFGGFLEDPTEKMRFENKKLEQQNRQFEQEFGLKQTAADIAKKRLILDEDKSRTRENLARAKIVLDEKKAALDEWQTRNPQGEIRVDADSNIVVIDRITGAVKPTGIKSGDLTEAEKIRLNLSNQRELEADRQKNRLELEGRRQSGRTRDVSPSQQRVAEDDAAYELLRDKYPDLVENELVTFDKDTGVNIKEPVGGTGMFDDFTVEDAKKLKTRLDSFRKDWKAAAEARMNKEFSRTYTDIEPDEDLVDMIAPDGGKLKVPTEKVEEMKAAGAKVVGNESLGPLYKSAAEAEAANKPKPTSIVGPGAKLAEGIELIYNAEGKVIGARNKKK